MSRRELKYEVAKLEKEYGKITRYGHIISSKGRRLTTAPMLENDAKKLVYHYNAFLDIKPKLTGIVGKWEQPK